MVEEVFIADTSQRHLEGSIMNLGEVGTAREGEKRKRAHGGGYQLDMPSDLSFPRAGSPKIIPCLLLFSEHIPGFLPLISFFILWAAPHSPGTWFILPCQITRTMLRAQRVIIKTNLSERPGLLSSPSNVKQSALPPHPLPPLFPRDIFLLPSVLFCPWELGRTFRTSDLSQGHKTSGLEPALRCSLGTLSGSL